MKKISKVQKELIRRVLVYCLMVLAVIASVALVTFIILGFRLNLVNGEIERYAFLHFSSTPSGSIVSVDGKNVSNKTPNKVSVEPGEHTIVMKKPGYQTWTKTISVEAGTLKWLNYALFVPDTLAVEPLTAYPQIYSSLTSPKGRSILVQPSESAPIFDLIDVSSDSPKTINLTVPETVYSESATIGVNHSFKVQNWDESGRYVLVKHTYNDQFEWLVLDVQNINLSKNITQMFDINISVIDFAGATGNKFYIIESNGLRKLDLLAETISRLLVGNVSDFKVYESNTVIYIGSGNVAGNKVVGIYRDGDESSYILKTTDSAEAIKIATVHYFNEDYVAYSIGRNVSILGGRYPSSVADSATSLQLITTFDVADEPSDFGFSPTGEFLMARDSSAFYTYDLEYQSLSSSGVGCAATQSLIGWLDENYLWSTCDDSLVIREFDGANKHDINSAISGQAVALTHSGRYLYSIGKVESGYQLQRVQMINR